LVELAGVVKGRRQRGDLVELLSGTTEVDFMGLTPVGTGRPPTSTPPVDVQGTSGDLDEP